MSSKEGTKERKDKGEEDIPGTSEGRRILEGKGNVGGWTGKERGAKNKGLVRGS